MNPTLLAREALAERGSLDPQPEDDPTPWGVHPTRLLREVTEDGEFWISPATGSAVMLTEDGEEVWV